MFDNLNYDKDRRNRYPSYSTVREMQHVKALELLIMYYCSAFFFFGNHNLFCLNQVSNGDDVPSLLKSRYGNDFISTISGLYFLVWSSTFTKGLRSAWTRPFVLILICAPSRIGLYWYSSMQDTRSVYFKIFMFQVDAILKTEDDPLIAGTLAVAIPSIRELRFSLEIFSLSRNDFLPVSSRSVMIKSTCLLRNDFTVAAAMFVSHWMMYDLFSDFDRWRKTFFPVTLEMSQWWSESTMNVTKS